MPQKGADKCREQEKASWRAFYPFACALWLEFVAYKFASGIEPHKSPECTIIGFACVGEEVFMAFVALEKLHQLHDGYRKAFTLAGQPLLLLQENGKTLLIKNACPHADASLTYATVSHNALRCPLHGMEFDLTSGRTSNPACQQALQFIPLIYEGNTLGVDVV